MSNTTLILIERHISAEKDLPPVRVVELIAFCLLSIANKNALPGLVVGLSSFILWNVCLSRTSEDTKM